MLINKKYRNIKKINYIHKKLDSVWEKSKTNHYFKQFKCSVEFSGKYVADKNLEIYWEKQNYLDKKVRQLNLVLGTLLNR